MKKDIILAGVGGQGILSIAAAVGTAARQEKLFVKQSEVHGMSQRGGEVQAHLRLSSEPIASDLIPEGKADMIVGMEPMESLRYINFLREDGWIVSNEAPFVNIEDYPELSKILDQLRAFPNHVVINADEIARSCGSAKSSNMVLLGAASSLLGLKQASLKKAIEILFSRKGEKMLKMNLDAFEKGYNHYKDSLKANYVE